MPARPRLLPGRDWPRERIVTTAAAAVAIAAIAALLAHGVRGGRWRRQAPRTPAGSCASATATACGPATDDVTREVAFVVARRLRDEERAGQTVNRARHSIASDRTLAARRRARQRRRRAPRGARAAVQPRARRDAAGAARDGRVITRVGGRLVLTPVFATLRRHGRVVGSVEFSVQDDRATGC